MTKAKLAALLEHYGRVLKNKGKLKSHDCPHCAKPIPTVIPTKDLVSSKGYWDSLSSCPFCDALYMVWVWPSGRIKTRKP